MQSIAEPLQVVELLRQPAEVAGAVVVAVEERRGCGSRRRPRVLNQSGFDSNQWPGSAGRRVADCPASRPRRTVPTGCVIAVTCLTCSTWPARREADVVAAEPPVVALAGQQVADVERRRQAEAGGHDARRPSCGCDRVEVDADDHDVRAAALRVGDQLRRSRVSRNCRSSNALQRRLARGGSRSAAGRAAAAARRARAASTSYFSESRYSSLPCAHRHVLEALVAGVDPVDGESVAASTSRASKAGRPPSCRYSCRMSGVFAKKFGRK